MEEEDGNRELEEHKFGKDDTTLLIYTSGSTGKPKAAKVVNSKVIKFVVAFGIMPGITENDVCYNCLPLYHASGGLVFIAPFVSVGCTTVIRKKFSASNFFADCIKYDVTYAGYIGEIWKYLLAQPLKESDRQHKVKNICGNGLRSNLVPVVKERFGVEKVYEFYGATEGNAGMFNLDNTPGAVGFMFQLFPFLNTCCIVKADAETGDLIRDENGFAIRCKTNEVGTMIIPIKKMAEYYGYENNEKDSNRKIARKLF